MILNTPFAFGTEELPVMDEVTQVTGIGIVTILFFVMSISLYFIKKWKYQNRHSSNSLETDFAFTKNRLDEIYELIKPLKSAHDFWSLDSKKVWSRSHQDIEFILLQMNLLLGVERGIGKSISYNEWLEKLKGELFSKYSQEYPGASLRIQSSINRVPVDCSPYLCTICEMLLENAFKYSSSGMITFSIKKKKANIIIEVMDKSLESVYKKRKKNFSKNENTGYIDLLESGIGRAVVDKLLTEVKAELRVQQNAFNDDFSVALEAPIEWGEPVKVNVDIHCEPKELAFDSDLDELDHEESEKVLIVDDNMVNRKVLGKMVSSLGFDVEYAKNGLEAIERVEKGLEYVAILMDLEMPKLSGFEATKQIRILENEKKAPQIPIIAVTAQLGAACEKECIELGMQSLLSKPFKLETLDREISKNRVA